MSKKVKIEIKNRFTGDILFEYESEDNTIKQTLLKAVESGADLRDADLCGANLCGANLRGANLRGADLRDADLCGADLRDADLCGADLCGADLRDADLCGANLCGANLRGADLRGANLRGANLRGANLCGANLRGANLRGANLCGANLCGANLCGAVVDYNDRPEGYGDAPKIINSIKENSNLIPTEVYENHDALSSRWGMRWRNLLIIRKWEVKEKVEPAEAEDPQVINIGGKDYKVTPELLKALESLKEVEQ